MSTNATDNSPSTQRYLFTDNHSASFMGPEKKPFFDFILKHFHHSESQRSSNNSEDTKPLIFTKITTDKDSNSSFLKKSSSFMSTNKSLNEDEIGLLIEEESQSKLDSGKRKESKIDFETDVSVIKKDEAELLKNFWCLLKQIKKDENSKVKLIQALNKSAGQDAKCTARVLYFLRNMMMFGSEIGLKDRLNGLLALFSILKTWGKEEGAKTLQLYSVLEISKSAETFSKEMLVKFSETSIVIVKTVIQEEMLLGITPEKATYWCEVLQKLEEHCLLQDAQHSKSYLGLAFHNLLSELKKHDETKSVIQQYASGIKGNLAHLVEKMFGNKKLPMDSLIRSTVATTFSQYQFLRDFPTESDSPSEVIAGILSKIYKLTYERCLTEKHKREDGVQFFFQCVAFQSMYLIEASGPILTGLSSTHETIVDGLARAIFAWFKKDEDGLFKLIKSCCESEAQIEKEDSAFRGKTLSIILSNHFNSDVNKAFHASMVKLLKEMLGKCKKPVNLCMSVRFLRDYETDRDQLLGKLDKTALNDYFLGLSLEDMRKELENVPLEDLSKIVSLPNPIIYDFKNQATFFDIEIGVLPGDLKSKLLKIDPILTETTKLTKFIGENTFSPSLKDKLSVNQLPQVLVKEIANNFGNTYENATIGQLMAAKLEKGLKEKIQVEVDRIYEQLFDRLKTQAKRAQDKKTIRQTLESLNKGEVENILRRVHFTQLSTDFQNSYCEKVCEKNKSEFTDFMTNFLKSFYQAKLNHSSRKLLEIRREVIKKYFPQLEIPLTGNMLLLRWILPAIINDREWDKHPFHRSIVITVTAILQQMSMEGDGDNTQTWASVYKEMKEKHSSMHRDFIDRNSKSQETSMMLNLNQ